MIKNLIARVDEVLIPVLRRYGITILRFSLATVFVWFGVLKILDVSPVVDLVASTVYWLDPAWFVPTLGVVETLIGLSLAFRFGLRTALAALSLQLLGTFLVFVLEPDIAFQGANPLALTTEGEFIVKNLVLLAAAIVVGSRVGEPDESIGSMSEPQA